MTSDHQCRRIGWATEQHVLSQDSLFIDFNFVTAFLDSGRYTFGIDGFNEASFVSSRKTPHKSILLYRF